MSCNLTRGKQKSHRNQKKYSNLAKSEIDYNAKLVTFMWLKKSIFTYKKKMLLIKSILQVATHETPVYPRLQRPDVSSLALACYKNLHRFRHAVYLML